MRSEDDDWRTHLYNQERMIEQMNELIKAVGQVNNIESKQREQIIEQQEQMTEAVILLTEKMNNAGDQLRLAVEKLSSAFWGVLKVPIAMAVVGAASWAFLYEGKISERSWILIMAVAVFPWLGESLTAIGKIVRGHNNKTKT
jgi:predicted PurR-regulated permease PerM